MIAVDGKTLRGSGATDHPGRHLLAALDHGHGVVLAQVDVEAKTNEIPMFATVLDRIDLARAVVTADALHAQRAHAEYLAGRGAHYLITVKGKPVRHEALRHIPAAGGTDSKGGLLGPMAYLDPKGGGDQSMPANRRLGPGA